MAEEENKNRDEDEEEFERDLEEAGEEPQDGEPEDGEKADVSFLPATEGDRSDNDSKSYDFSSDADIDDIFETTDLYDDEVEEIPVVNLEVSQSAEAPAKTKRKHRAGFIVLDIVLILVILLCVFLIVFNILFTGIYVVGSSMSPTLTGASNERSGGGDYVYLNPRSEPSYGDIVVVYSEKLDENIIKRAIAFEGDTVDVDVEEGIVSVNGAALEEDYVAPENNTGKGKDYPEENLHLTVGEGEIYLLGDNRDNSNDSRSLGCFEAVDLLGVVNGWALSCKGFTTGVYTFFNITLPGLFGLGLGWRST